MFTHVAILDLSTGSLLILLAIILLLFGAKKLPELSRSLGDSARELRKGINGEEENKHKQTGNSQDYSQA
jgi:sec-independent protein translocase protein TatA